MRLPKAARSGAWSFAVLYALESLSRASIASIVPIQAYDLLRDKQAVSLLYFAVGVAGVAATVSAPILIQHVARRWIYSLGVAALVAACAALASFSLPGQAVGMLLRAVGAGILAIALNLYIMDGIRRADFVHAESLRLALSTLSWTVGPGFGVWLYVEFGIWVPYAWSAAWAVVLLAVFWYLRLSDNGAIRSGVSRPVSPLASLRRFHAQPRLRLAWLIAFGRSCYWTTFYVYAPILMVATGEGKLSGGVVVSVGNAMLLLSLGWGRLGQRFGVRRVVVLSFALAAAAAAGAALAGEAHPWLAALFLLCGAAFAIALDAVGGVPFLRAVHPYERPEMTAVYRTNFDMSELLPPLVYSVILGFSGLGGVFAALSVFCALCGFVAWRHLPRSL